MQFQFLFNVSIVQSSPFCTGQPVFTLAEPKDVVIICGEFNSGVEILKESWEPEQLFSVTKIIQHPNYKLTTVRQQKTFLSILSPSPNKHKSPTILTIRIVGIK